MRKTALVTGILILVTSPVPLRAGDEETVLRYGALGAPRTLDPHGMTGSIEFPIGEALFEGLTYLDAATLEPKPGVARSWDISPDGRTYTFSLREEARWSDGKPVTAHDFAWSWRRLLDPERPSEMAFLLHGIRGAKALEVYGTRARDILGPLPGRQTIVEKLRRLRQTRGASLDAATWRRFVHDSGLAEAVEGTNVPILRAALRARSGGLDSDLLAGVEEALIREGRRLATAHAEALESFGRTRGVRAVDDRTLVVELEGLQPYFLGITATATAAPVPRHVLERNADRDWWRKPVVNGPFRLAAFRPDGSLRLERNPSYWGRKNIRLEAVEAIPIENPAEALARFKRGEVDWTTNYPLAMTAALRKERTLRTNPVHVVYFLRLNCTRPFLSSALVRRALAMAIDRTKVVRALDTTNWPAHRLVPPGMPGYDPPPEAVHFDPKRAGELMQEAAFERGAEVPQLSLLFNSSESHLFIAKLVAQHWQHHLGVNLAPVGVEWQAFQAGWTALRYDVARGGWIGDYRDPATFLEMWTTGSPNNGTGWSDERYDRLLAAARDIHAAARKPAPWLEGLTERPKAEALLAAATAKGDDAKRRGALERLRLLLLREAEALLLREMPVIPVYFYAARHLVKPHVKGFYTELAVLGPDGKPLPNGADHHPLRALWIDRK